MKPSISYFIYSYIYLDVTLLDLLLFDFHPVRCVAVSTHIRLLSDKSATSAVTKDPRCRFAISNCISRYFKHMDVK